MKRLLIALLILLVVIPATVVLAAVSYSADITVSNNGTTSYAQIGVTASENVTLLVSNGFITPSGLDSRVRQSSSDLPFMLATDRVTFAVPSLINTSNVYHFVTGQTAAPGYQIVPGHNGYITTNDAASIEWGNNTTFMFPGYLDTTFGEGKYIIDKTDNGTFGGVSLKVSGNTTGTLVGKIRSQDDSNPSTYTEVDPGGHLAETPTSVIGTGVLQNSDAYLYTDYGASHFNDFAIPFEINTANQAVNPFGLGGTALSNGISTIAGFAATDVSFVTQSRGGGVVWVQIIRGNNVAETHYVGTSATNYYCTAYRAFNDDRIHLGIYSDANRTILLEDLSLAGFGGATKYRYQYDFVNLNDGTVGRQWDGTVQNIYITRDETIIEKTGVTSRYLVGNLSNNSTTFSLQIDSGTATTNTSFTIPDTTRPYRFMQASSMPYADNLSFNVSTIPTGGAVDCDRSNIVRIGGG